MKMFKNIIIYYGFLAKSEMFAPISEQKVDKFPAKW